ncbi:MAG: D-alanyl-D-alanine carboxypeptidase family protein [Nitrospira sp.]
MLERQREGRTGFAIGLLLFLTVIPPFVSHAGADESPAQPPVQAAALHLIELKTGRVLLTKNATAPLPPASLTKIMTAVVALHDGGLHDIVHIDGRALRHHSSLNFRAGERFLLRDLLAAMLVTSANDACEAVAWHIGGTVERFVNRMNERAKTLGLAHTHFVNPCGFDAPGHYSTAEDLARLTEEALRLPEFAMMVRTVERDIDAVDGSRRIHLSSTNELLLDPDVTGVKTGFTNRAGRCLIASMGRNGHQLLLVGLNVKDRWEQATRLLRYGEAVLQAAAP